MRDTAVISSTPPARKVQLRATAHGRGPAFAFLNPIIGANSPRTTRAAKETRLEVWTSTVSDDPHGGTERRSSQ